MATARQDQGTDIDGITFAVFVLIGVGNAVTAAALVRTEGINGAQRVPKRGDVIGGLVSDPGSKGFPPPRSARSL